MRASFSLQIAQHSRYFRHLVWLACEDFRQDIVRVTSGQAEQPDHALIGVCWRDAAEHEDKRPGQDLQDHRAVLTTTLQNLCDHRITLFSRLLSLVDLDAAGCDDKGPIVLMTDDGFRISSRPPIDYALDFKPVIADERGDFFDVVVIDVDL